MTQAEPGPAEARQGNRIHEFAVPPAVKAVAVDKWFGSFHALKAIDLSVPQGARIVICGPSGSGKSTLIRCINGLENFQSGTIHVCGADIGDQNRMRDIRHDV